MPLTPHPASATSRGASPWTLGFRVRLLLWEWVWTWLCAWTPKPFNRWRLVILRAFGAQIRGQPFVHQRARIRIPWHVEIEEGACVGDRAHLYSLDRIHLGRDSIIAQEAYLCTGTHDLSIRTRPLLTAPIIVGSNVFVGARAFVLPGISLGEDSVVGACSVVTQNVPDRGRVAGNPAVPISSSQNG